jgi:hypothetical protein
MRLAGHEARRTGMINSYKVSVGILKERDYLDNLRVDDRTTVQSYNPFPSKPP